MKQTPKSGTLCVGEGEVRLVTGGGGKQMLGDGLERPSNSGSQTPGDQNPLEGLFK